jgi:hypothetical protein
MVSSDITFLVAEKTRVVDSNLELLQGNIKKGVAKLG